MAPPAGCSATTPRKDHDDRFLMPEQSFVTKTMIFGAPDPRAISTSHVARFNLTTRHTVGRKRRRCLAFSKTVRGHRAAVGLSLFVYNFCKVHRTLETTPAQAAGLAERPWTMEEVVTAALAEEPIPAPVAQPLALPTGRANLAPLRTICNSGGGRPRVACPEKLQGAGYELLSSFTSGPRTDAGLFTKLTEPWTGGRP
jgi:hypothetical protein